ncbi:hypothetical protein C8Q73DRAFT_372669 [Cubamyces lactineus]|nr:hypothetical protein C8Q73DRAFT_372669 [Cubamyces lactineus]
MTPSRAVLRDAMPSPLLVMTLYNSSYCTHHHVLHSTHVLDCTYSSLLPFPWRRCFHNPPACDLHALRAPVLSLIRPIISSRPPFSWFPLSTLRPSPHLPLVSHVLASYFASSRCWIFVSSLLHLFGARRHNDRDLSRASWKREGAASGPGV